MRNIPQLSPQDEYNRVLGANTHPADWTNPTPAGRYNLVVIGAGTAGLVTAAGAAGLGAKVALIERHYLGGDCLNVGCVPSKCIIRSSRVVAEIRDAGLFGIGRPDGVQVDFGAVMERMRRIRSHISHHDSVKRFSELGVDVFLGDASFTGPETVEVDGRSLRFKKGGHRVGRPGGGAASAHRRNRGGGLPHPTRRSSPLRSARNGWLSSAPAPSAVNWRRPSSAWAARWCCSTTAATSSTARTPTPRTSSSSSSCARAFNWCSTAPSPAWPRENGRKVVHYESGRQRRLGSSGRDPGGSRARAQRGRAQPGRRRASSSTRSAA